MTQRFRSYVFYLSIGLDMTRIAQINLHRLRIPLKKPFITSLGPNLEADNVVVIVRTSDGLIGHGECSPFWTINGETAETCLSVGAHLAKALIGHDPGDIEGAHVLMDRLIFGNNSIKSAFDIALHDIAAQAADLPLWKFLGGKDRSDLFTDYTVSIGDPEQMAADAEDIVRNGFPVIKVKLGGDGDLDIRRIRAIRERIPSIVPLRIDANQGWDPDTAIRVLNALGDLNIQHCEEPIPRWQYMDMRRVKEASPIPIMADESCCDHHDAERLIGLGACQRFNIKLGKSGGLFKAKKIIALAEQAGMEVQIGGFLESRLAFTASASLALTSSTVKHCDMDTPLMFKDDPVEGGLTYGPLGSLNVSDAIGIGASISERYRSGTQVIEVG